MLSLMEENFPASVKFTRPEGGMFIWVELPEGLDADGILDEAVEAGVAYIPCLLYTSPSPRDCS